MKNRIINVNFTRILRHDRGTISRCNNILFDRALSAMSASEMRALLKHSLTPAKFSYSY